MMKLTSLEDVFQQNLNEAPSTDVNHTRLIASARRAGRYEFAGHGAARARPEHLGCNEAAKLLGLALENEEETDARLAEPAGAVAQKAAP